MQKSLKSKVYGYFVSRWGGYRYKRSWLRLPICPFCGHEYKCGVELSEQYVNCFVCGYHGQAIDVISELESLSGLETIRFLEGSNFKEVYFKEPKVKLSEERKVILPEGYTNIRRGKDSKVGDLARNYLIKRGFNIEYMGRLNIGYIRGVDNPLFGYLIIPFVRNRKVVFYQTRRYLGEGPKYNNPTRDQVGIGKTQIIYNERALSHYKEVNLFEGVFNALTLGPSSTCIQGKVLSSWQKTKYISSPVDLINICLDRDAMSYAFGIAWDLLGIKKVRIVVFPWEEDANDLGRGKTLSLINKAPVLTRFQDLITFKNRFNENRGKN